MSNRRTARALVFTITALVSSHSESYPRFDCPKASSDVGENRGFNRYRVDKYSFERISDNENITKINSKSASIPTGVNIRFPRLNSCPMIHYDSTAVKYHGDPIRLLVDEIQAPVYPGGPGGFVSVNMFPDPILSPTRPSRNFSSEISEIRDYLQKSMDQALKNPNNQDASLASRNYQILNGAAQCLVAFYGDDRAKSYETLANEISLPRYQAPIAVVPACAVTRLGDGWDINLERAKSRSDLARILSILKNVSSLNNSENFTFFSGWFSRSYDPSIVLRGDQFSYRSEKNPSYAEPLINAISCLISKNGG